MDKKVSKGYYFLPDPDVDVSVAYMVPNDINKKGAPLVLMHFHKNFTRQFFQMEKKEVIDLHNESNKTTNIMVASISHTAVAHLTIQRLTSVSCNSYLIVVISHKRERSKFLSPHWSSIAITFLHRLDMWLICDIVIL